MNRANKKRISDAYASTWVFPWRRTFRRRWTLLLGVVIVLPIVALLLTTVRVRVFPVPPALSRTGEMIMVPYSPENLDWLEKISQKTPFPLQQDDRATEALTDAHLLRGKRISYQPQSVLRDVNLPSRKPLFDQIQVLPQLAISAATPLSPVMEKPRLRPRLRLLDSSKIQLSPVAWPEFYGDTDTLAGRKFLLEIDQNGKVIGCISVPHESAKRNIALENWLIALSFPQTKSPLGWVGGEIIWVNHD